MGKLLETEFFSSAAEFSAWKEMATLESVHTFTSSWAAIRHREICGKNVEPEENPRLAGGYTDKKGNNIFLIYKEIQMGSGAKSYTL
jgi:hypothetical protein